MLSRREGPRLSGRYESSSSPPAWWFHAFLPRAVVRILIVMAAAVILNGILYSGPLSVTFDNSSFGEGDTEGGIPDPIEIKLSSPTPPEIGRKSILEVEATSRWTDLENVRMTIDGVEGILVDGLPDSGYELPLNVANSAEFSLMVKQEGLLRIAIHIVGSSPEFGNLGGYAQVFLDVPEVGPGRLYFGNPPRPLFAGTALKVEPFANSAKDGAIYSGITPVAETHVPLPLPESLLNGETGDSVMRDYTHSTFVVTGRWLYWLEDDTTNAPQRWATVQVWDSDVLIDDLLWEGITDLNGEFTSDAIPRSEGGLAGNQDVYVKFFACNAAVCVKTTGDSTYNWVTGTTTIGNEDVFDVGSWTSATTEKFAQRPFQYINDGWDYAVNLGGLGAILGEVRVFIPDSCTFYTLADDTIHLCADGIDDKSPDDVNHEYGHYVQDKMYNDVFWPSPGGQHFLCGDNQDRGLSWTEGFANFFGPRANNEIVDAADISYSRPWDGSSFTINMETASFCASTVQGDDNEMRVAWSLWDLTDNANDGALDIGISYSAATIFSAINDCDQNNYRNFYDGGLCNWVTGGNPRYDLLATAFQNTIDYNIKPTAAVTSQTAFTWESGTITVGATASDPDTPVAFVQFRISEDNVCSDSDVLVGDDPSSPYSLAFDTASLTDDPDVWVCAKASDNMEESAWEISASSIGVDNTAPITASALAGLLGDNGWYTGSVTVSLTASDGLSGVSATSYRVDGGSLQSYTGPFIVGGDGIHTVEYSSVDAAGNAETSQQVQLSLDGTPPQALFTVPAENSWQAQPSVAVRWTGTDATSGVDRYIVTVDGGVPITLSAQDLELMLTGLPEGLHLIELRAFDRAGNFADATLHFGVDTTPPTVAVSSPAQDTTIVQASVTIEWMTADALSGVASCSVSLDGDTPVDVGTQTSFTFGSLPDGAHDITVECTDVAGNVVQAVAPFSVDTNPFSPTGPFGPWLLVIVVVLLISFTAVLILLWRRKR